MILLKMDLYKDEIFFYQVSEEWQFDYKPCTIKADFCEGLIFAFEYDSLTVWVWQFEYDSIKKIYLVGIQTYINTRHNIPNECILAYL